MSASVKYLIPATKDYHVTRVVDAVMELKSSPDIDNYLYLDPKFQPDAAPRKTTPFRQAIVFVLGGGNYLEYLNLMDYAKRVRSRSPEILLNTNILHSQSNKRISGWARKSYMAPQSC